MFSEGSLRCVVSVFELRRHANRLSRPSPSADWLYPNPEGVQRVMSPAVADFPNSHQINWVLCPRNCPELPGIAGIEVVSPELRYYVPGFCENCVAKQAACPRDYMR